MSAKIMIVDDDPELLIAIRSALRLRMPDVIVETCDSALVAMQKVTDRQYDAVVTDIKMPGMDGLTLLSKIREIDSELPTLLITGHGQHDLAVQALRGGAFDFIQKPIERDYFVASLNRAIRLRKLDRKLRQQQQALENHRNELEQAVKARTEELRESNRRKDEFLAMLSHELRTPLACILGSAELVLSYETESECASDHCRVIVQQATHMSRLLNDLLDLSRINTNKIRLSKTNVRLATITEAAVTATQSLFRQRRLSMSMDPGLDQQQVHADPTRIEQVLINLLNNAAKYSQPDSEIRFLIHRAGDEIVFVVDDDGIGIPASELAKIFDPFMQAGDFETHSDGGLGIGLALVRQLVELHGGSITAASEGQGKGSCFTVRLPIAVDVIECQSDAPLPQPLVVQRVLLVEDQEALSTMTKLILERIGHQVVGIAADGPSAIEQAIAHDPDVILMDIGLPGMSGLEAARELRAIPQLKTTLLIALTGYGSPDDRRRIIEAGFDEHLVKPCSFKSLSESLGCPRRSLELSDTEVS